MPNDDSIRPRKSRYRDDDDRPRRSRDDDDRPRRRRDDDDDDDDRPRRGRKRRGGNAGLIWALVGGGTLLVAGLVVLIIFLVKSEKKDGDGDVAGGPGGKVNAARARTDSFNNLKQMTLAMHSHHDVYLLLPSAAICDPTGRPLLSWRVKILPYVEQMPLHGQFRLNEPWDSPHNKQFIAKMPDVYRNPKRSDKPGYTNYRVIVAADPRNISPRPAFEWNEGMGLGRSFPDGTSNTIAIVEARDSVPWTAPDELEYRHNGPLPNFDMSGDGFAVSLTDGSVRTVQKTISENTLRNAITRDDGHPPGSDW